MGTTDDRESISEPLEVTAVSRIHGTRRIHEVTGGHEEDRIRVEEEPRGHHRTREGTAFAPVRDREAPGSNPGPPTKSGLGVHRYVEACQTSTPRSWGRSQCIKQRPGGI